MKHSILSFDQEEVLKLHQAEVKGGKRHKVSIDIVDLVILDYLAKEVENHLNRGFVIEGTRYTVIPYQTILDDLPILHIGERQLVRRLEKIRSFNLIKFRRERIPEIGTFTMFRMEEPFYELLSF